MDVNIVVKLISASFSDFLATS